MAGVVVIAMIVVFIAGAIAGAILLVSLASVREDRAKLTQRAPGRIARAGRLVTGLRVVDLDRQAARRGAPVGHRVGVSRQSRPESDQDADL